MVNENVALKNSPSLSSGQDPSTLRQCSGQSSSGQDHGEH